MIAQGQRKTPERTGAKDDRKREKEKGAKVPQVVEIFPAPQRRGRSLGASNSTNGTNKSRNIPKLKTNQNPRGRG